VATPAPVAAPAVSSELSGRGEIPESDGAERQVIPAGPCKVSIRNDVSELKRLTEALDRFLVSHAVSGRAQYAVQLAVDELVTNVIRYAYVDDDPHQIELELSVEGEQLVLSIVDDGRPFDPREGPALNQHAEEREVGGLGLLLVLDMVDRLKYQRVDERNQVEVRVQLSPETIGAVPSSTDS
jgi:anti-sigma regulatory factor (Ser/Thr protein kinase)